MNSVLLVLINLDSDIFFNDTNFFKYIEEFRIQKKQDLSLLTFYSTKEIYFSKNKMKLVSKGREDYPKVVLGKTFTKNDGNLTSLYITKNDKNKEYIYSYMMKYLSKIIDVGGVLILDDNLKLSNEDLSKCFGEREYRVINKIEKKEENKTLRKLFF